MAIYDYKCLKCNTIFEYFSKRLLGEDERKPVCPICENKNKKQLEFHYPATSVHFKGTGWTNTIYADSLNPDSVSGCKRVEPKSQDGLLYKNANKKKKKC